jgi:DNA invertase Pin-like site-specific DNA recombinase
MSVLHPGDTLVVVQLDHIVHNASDLSNLADFLETSHAHLKVLQGTARTLDSFFGINPFS